jgi:uncharacterized protein (TIGR03118 family)
MSFTHRYRTAISAGLALALWAAPAGALYSETDLISDGFVPALTVDTAFVNPWGIVYPPGGPFWINENGSGNSALFNSTGQPFPIANPLVVTVPPPSGSPPGTTSNPTGIVFNGSTTDFLITPGNAARFMFATENGTIAGWNPTVNPTQAVTVINNSATGAVYKGATVLSNGTTNLLYAANFAQGRVEVFNSSFSPVRSFTGANLPPGFAPFNVQALNGHLFVTYALLGPSGRDDMAGPGNGFVDEFDANGTFLRRVTSGGTLNSPWGLAFAPATFGEFANDLIVGNFGDGRLNAFDPATGQFRGQLLDSNGNPIAIDGLWGLIVGNGGNGGDPNFIYFAAGIDEEQHGLFGSVRAIPEPGALGLLAAAVLGLLALRRGRSA